jgi:hypothetical protein
MAKVLMIMTYRLVLWTKDSMVVVLVIRMERKDFLELMSVRMPRTLRQSGSQVMMT